MSPERMAYVVKEEARRLGFARAGIADLRPIPHREAFARWLASGMAATMRYLHRQAARRLEPERIVPGAKRAVVLTRNYYRPDPPPVPGTGRVARYARGRDYHVALAQPLEQLARFVASLGPPGTLARAYCDAGPVPERELAQRAGIGWIGKNTMLIDPRAGSFFFLAVILTDLELAVDLPFEADRCGSCRRCLEACPTGALVAERVLDSRRCIAYWTIEHRGPIDPELADSFQNWVFGCDACQEVCPWNVKFAAPHDDPALGHDPELARLDLLELAQLDDADFEFRFGGTALTRAGAAGLRRNARLLVERNRSLWPMSSTP